MYRMVNVPAYIHICPVLKSSRVLFLIYPERPHCVATVGRTVVVTETHAHRISTRRRKERWTMEQPRAASEIWEKHDRVFLGCKGATRAQHLDVVSVPRRPHREWDRVNTAEVFRCLNDVDRGCRWGRKKRSLRNWTRTSRPEGPRDQAYSSDEVCITYFNFKWLISLKTVYEDFITFPSHAKMICTFSLRCFIRLENVNMKI